MSEGNYNDANKAKQKYDELKRKETIRQINILKSSQEQELNAIQEAQKAQFLEFSQAWDNYMQEYEITALKSIDNLKVFLVKAYFNRNVIQKKLMTQK